jgi:TonB family protein
MKAGYLAAILLVGLSCAAEQAALPEEAPRMVACERLGNKIKDVPPQYPQAARLAHVQGDVVLNAVIDKKGRIKHLNTISGHPLLVPAVRDAVKQWRYKPYTVDGKKVEVQTIITVKFHM